MHTVNATAGHNIDARKTPELMFRQALSFCLHICLSLLIYAAIFFGISYFNPMDWPALATVLLVFVLPMVVAYGIHLRGTTTEAGHIWIAGVVWLLMVTVYVLELPTGPGSCEHCTAVSKIWLTLFDLNIDSNLISGAGRVVGTWPALAVIGYSIGAGLSLRRHETD
jgi:hypothetical protein